MSNVPEEPTYPWYLVAAKSTELGPWHCAFYESLEQAKELAPELAKSSVEVRVMEARMIQRWTDDPGGRFNSAEVQALLNGDCRKDTDQKVLFEKAETETPDERVRGDIPSEDGRSD